GTYAEFTMFQLNFDVFRRHARQREQHDEAILGFMDIRRRLPVGGPRTRTHISQELSLQALGLICELQGLQPHPTVAVFRIHRSTRVLRLAPMKPHIRAGSICERVPDGTFTAGVALALRNVLKVWCRKLRGLSGSPFAVAGSAGSVMVSTQGDTGNPRGSGMPFCAATVLSRSGRSEMMPST